MENKKQINHYDSTSELERNHSENDRPGLVGVKNMLDKSKNHFYEFKLRKHILDEKSDLQRKSLILTKNKGILENLHQPLKNILVKNAKYTRNAGMNEHTFRQPHV